MDAKNRVTVPSEWLEREEERFYAVPSADGKYLIVMPPAVFDRVEEQFADSGAPPQEIRKTIRQFYSAAHALQTDKQGRVLLPEEHCKRVGLHGEVMVVGSRSRFEIWSLTRWTETSGEDEATYQKVAEMIGL